MVRYTGIQAHVVHCTRAVHVQLGMERFYINEKRTNHFVNYVENTKRNNRLVAFIKHNL